MLVGGHTGPALRRAARYGTGWYGFAITPEQTARILEKLKQSLEAEERSLKDFDVIVTPLNDDQETLDAFAELGVNRLVLHMGSQAPAKLEKRLVQLEDIVRSVA